MHVRTDRFAHTARPPCRLIAVALEGAPRNNVDCRHRVKIRVRIASSSMHTLGKRKIIQLLFPRKTSILLRSRNVLPLQI